VPMRRLLLAALVLTGCSTTRSTFDDAIVHTDRLGYNSAYAVGPNMAAGDARPVIPPATVLPPGATMIDLTHPFGNDTLYFPGDGSFELSPVHRGRTNAGWYYAANRFAAPEHGGTHIDAPSHFAEGHANIDALPLGRLIAPAVVIDISEQANRDPDALLEPAAIEAHEATHGPIAPDSIVLVRTDWAARWPSRGNYLGNSTDPKKPGHHFPGISEAAAKALILRKVSAVGIDAAGIDGGQARDFLAHRAFASVDIPAFTNLARLDMLPPVGALVIALPMKIGGGTGAPLRIVAIAPARR
jgi:kynurenine formamidase